MAGLPNEAQKSEAVSFVLDNITLLDEGPAWLFMVEVALVDGIRRFSRDTAATKIQESLNLPRRL